MTSATRFATLALAAGVAASALAAGSSGGDLTTMPVVHELGHVFAGLGDEYIQRNDSFNEDAKEWEETTVNVTPFENARVCKWHYWVEEEWPGLFGLLKLPRGTNVANVEGAGWVRGLYRPEKGCIMRCNRDTFCAVCNEAMEGNFFRYIDLFSVLEPRVGDIVLWQDESVDVRIVAIDLLRQPPEGLKSRLDLYLRRGPGPASGSRRREERTRASRVSGRG